VENRRDDWRASVDERLARMDRIIRGDPEDKLDGLIEAIHQMQKEINRFNAILNPDHLGHGGLLNDIRSLMGRRERLTAREGYFWHFATAVFVQFIILAGLLIVNWDHIQAYIVLHQHIHQAATIESNTKKLKAKRSAHKPRPRPVLPPPVVEEQPEAVTNETE
jgi:hypothetical protein